MKFVTGFNATRALDMKCELTKGVNIAREVAMGKDWSERLKKTFPLSVRQTVKDAYKAINDFVFHVRLSHWHALSTAPCNQELELRISEGGKDATLEFPCLQTNTGAWINVDLGSAIIIKPVQWRVWQRQKSPEPHRSQLKLNGRSAIRPSLRNKLEFAR